MNYSEKRILDIEWATVKNNIKATFVLSFINNYYYQIDALVNKKIVGFCNFFMFNSSCFLNYIGIENKVYENLGIASKILYIVENFAKKHDCYYVTGKYVPKSESAEHFYEKNGYEIAYDYDEHRTMVSKSLIFKHKEENALTLF